MKKISNWAASNVWAARYIIAAAHVLLVFIAMLLAGAWQQMGVAFPTVLVTLFIGVLLVVALVPSRAANAATVAPKQKRFLFPKQLRFFSFGLAAFVMVWSFYASGLFLKEVGCTTLHGNTMAMVLPLKQAESVVAPSSEKVEKASLAKKLRTYIKENKEEWKAMKHWLKTNATADQVFLYVLLILVALLLLYAVAWLACSLSCNGQEALAVLVLLAGLALIIFLGVHFWKKIKRSNPRLGRRRNTTAE